MRTLFLAAGVGLVLLGGLVARAGEDAVKRIVDKVAPNWWDYCRQPEVLLEARRELARRIVEAD